MDVEETQSWRSCQKACICKETLTIALVIIRHLLHDLSKGMSSIIQSSSESLNIKISLLNRSERLTDASGAD